MIILTCRTTDKQSTFPLFPDNIFDAIKRAKQMNDLGCEPLQVYDGEKDEHKDKEWIQNKIKELSNTGM